MLKTITAFSGFSVNNLQDAKDFYTKILSLVIENEEMGLQFKLPGGGSFFIYEKENHIPATYTNLNFIVSDIDAAVEDLKAMGVTFEHYENMTDAKGIARGKSKNMGPNIAWFKDPAGNFLSLIEKD